MCFNAVGRKRGSDELISSNNDFSSKKKREQWVHISLRPGYLIWGQSGMWIYGQRTSRIQGKNRARLLVRFPYWSSRLCIFEKEDFPKIRYLLKNFNFGKVRIDSLLTAPVWRNACFSKRISRPKYNLSPSIGLCSFKTFVYHRITYDVRFTRWH